MKISTKYHNLRSRKVSSFRNRVGVPWVTWSEYNSLRVQAEPLATVLQTTMAFYLICFPRSDSRLLLRTNACQTRTEMQFDTSRAAEGVGIYGSQDGDRESTLRRICRDDDAGVDGYLFEEEVADPKYSLLLGDHKGVLGSM